jgi:pyrroloquinoline quinone (PQQ) biosynthesis protein C
MDGQVARLEAAKKLLIEMTGSHSFLVRCRQATVSSDEIKLYLVQQGLYDQYFTRYLCAIMSNLPSNEAVQTMAGNLVRELGLAPNRPKPHHVMYREMLERCSLTLEGAQALPATQQLIDTMFKACRDVNPASGLGAICLGSESLLPSIYSDIMAGLKAHGAQPDDMEFFQVQVDRDEAHAQTLNDLMAEVASGRPDRTDRMLLVGQQLVSARLDFFSAIEQTCERQAQAEMTLAATSGELTLV